MDDMYEPNFERFLAAIYLEEPDRVPNWEPIIMGRNLDFILGKNVRLPGIPKSQTMDWDLNISDRINLCRKTGQDAILIPLTWAGTGAKAEKILNGFTRGVEAFTLEDSIIQSWEDLSKLREGPSAPPSIEQQIKKVQEALDAVKGSNIGVGVHLRSVICNTYSVMGFANFSKKLFTDRKLVEAVMDEFMNYSVKMAEAVSKLDIDFFFFDDDIADSHGTIISPRLLEELWVPRSEMILKPIRRKNIPIVYHCCGKLDDVIPMVIGMGIKAVHPFQPSCNDIYAIKRRYGDEICLLGNMDIAGSLAFGTPQEVIKDTKEHIEKLAPGGGYIAGSSHSITNVIPPENFAAMIKAVQTYGLYK